MHGSVMHDGADSAEPVDRFIYRDLWAAIICILVDPRASASAARRPPMRREAGCEVLVMALLWLLLHHDAHLR